MTATEENFRGAFPIFRGDDPPSPREHVSPRFPRLLTNGFPRQPKRIPCNIDRLRRLGISRHRYPANNPPNIRVRLTAIPFRLCDPSLAPFRMESQDLSIQSSLMVRY